MSSPVVLRRLFSGRAGGSGGSFSEEDRSVWRKSKSGSSSKNRTHTESEPGQVRSMSSLQYSFVSSRGQQSPHTGSGKEAVAGCDVTHTLHLKAGSVCVCVSYHRARCWPQNLQKKKRVASSSRHPETHTFLFCWKCGPFLTSIHFSDCIMS